MNAIPPVFRQDPLARIANIGGPMSRSRTERIRCSLLGQDGGWIRCPSVIRLGLDFGRRDPLAELHRLLHAEGLPTAEDLRPRVLVPERPLICRPLTPAAGRLAVKEAKPEEVLRQALLLGLCTAYRFDPERPVLWTRTSVTRALELFDPEGFYA
jgi:hypothetical protein